MKDLIREVTAEMTSRQVKHCSALVAESHPRPRFPAVRPPALNCRGTAARLTKLFRASEAGALS